MIEDLVYPAYDEYDSNRSLALQRLPHPLHSRMLCHPDLLP